MEKKCTLDDFVTGFIAGLAYNNIRLLLVNELDWKISYIFYQWKKTLEIENTINFRFHLLEYKFEDSRNIHAYNPDLRAAFRFGSYRNIMFYDEDGFYRIRISSPQEAELYFKNVPGSEKIWKNLSDMFIKTFPHQVA